VAQVCAAAAAGLVLTVVVGCSGGEPVAVLGDSITALDAADMQQRFDGEYALVISAQFGRTAEEALADTRAGGVDTGVEQVIVNLGTNDVLRGIPTATTVDALSALVGLFPGARCIHLVNVNEHLVEQSSGESRSAAAVELNEGIDRLAVSDDRLSVVDWAAATTATLNDADPPWSTLTSDSIHPTAEGNARLNDLHDEALRSCAVPEEGLGPDGGPSSPPQMRDGT
jgi:lysophospholipase L1-like esterase